MNKDKRKGWLKELKVGDKVACDFAPTYSRKRDYKILVIDKITPSGRIYAGNYKFNHAGYEIGSKDSTWSRTLKLEPVTDEIKNLIEKKQIIEEIKK